MKIGIYNELTVHTLGGAEYIVAVLAEDLKRGHQVEVINHCESMTVDKLAEFAGTDLGGVTMRYVPYSNQPFSRARKPWRRHRAERNWQAALSARYDLFINLAHWIPPFCHAPVGVLIVLFPLFIPPDTWVGEPSRAPPFVPVRSLRDWYYAWQWPRRLASYQVKLAISHFTRSWTQRWWKLACPVMHPPAGTDFAVVAKTRTILSVGRFTPSWTMDSKKQLELIEVFADLGEAHRAGWHFYCAGRVSNAPQDQAYFESVRSRGESCRAHALASVPRAELKRLFEEAAIFWHATGLGTDPGAQPHAAEHFGISTAEAMAAGCVPVVINRGGLTELVQHGVNGFLWNDLTELKNYTMLLVRDEGLRRRMSEAARQRGQDFSRARFREELRACLQPIVLHPLRDAKEP